MHSIVISFNIKSTKIVKCQCYQCAICYLSIILFFLFVKTFLKLIFVCFLSLIPKLYYHIDRWNTRTPRGIVQHIHIHSIVCKECKHTTFCTWLLYGKDGYFCKMKLRINTHNFFSNRDQYSLFSSLPGATAKWLENEVSFVLIHRGGGKWHKMFSIMKRLDKNSKF